jgi:hypothetical protein
MLIKEKKIFARAGIIQYKKLSPRKGKFLVQPNASIVELVILIQILVKWPCWRANRRLSPEATALISRRVRTTFYKHSTL